VSEAETEWSEAETERESKKAGDGESVAGDGAETTTKVTKKHKVHQRYRC
jgi:hypothetical protein